MNKTCGDCASRRVEDNLCAILNTPVEKTTNACPLHHTKRCIKCSQPILGEHVIENNALYCFKCASLYGTCNTCQKANYCAFHQDPSPIPKTKVETFQQGPVTMQREIENPDRIAETCVKLCTCYHEEFGCLRRFNNCKEYTHD